MDDAAPVHQLSRARRRVLSHPATNHCGTRGEVSLGTTHLDRNGGLPARGKRRGTDIRGQKWWIAAMSRDVPCIRQFPRRSFDQVAIERRAVTAGKVVDAWLVDCSPTASRVIVRTVISSSWPNL